MTAVGGHRSGRPTHSSKRQNRYRLLVPPHPRGRDWRQGTRGVRGAALRAAATARTLAAGCSGAAGGAGGAGPPRVEKPDLTVAVVPSTDAAGFFIALYQGLFKAQGLHVTFVPATSSKTVIA